ncbi:MFS transporter [Rossellomorea vietnamensis]|uniref:MFS transporter n=1 Tax=Rossellomorea vietnamensis TaxID=218284 RepID=A0A6I6UHT0_9BACI|nr:MFS transporter [Rossellomorea vietnamensis]QHE61478.1 MFS transporter [Rossellomorea vietnamensis]
MGERAVKLSEWGDFPPLKKNYPVFRFMGGNLISFFGDQIYFIAIPLMVLSITGSPVSMGIVAALERLPILLQPFAGVLSDRFNRKRLLLFCDLGRCILVGIIGILFIKGTLEMWMVYPVVFGIGSLSQIYNTSQFASIPGLVRRKDLQAVNSLNSGMFNSALFLAPGIGGLIISFFNPGYALLVNSVSFLFSFLAIASLRMKRNERDSSRASVWGEIKEGFEFVLKTKPILYTNLAMVSSVFGTTLFLTLIVFHLKDSVNMNTVMIGWLLSAGGVGAIIGAVTSTFFRKWFSYRSILFTASVVGGLSILSFGLMESYFWLVVMNAVGTFCASMMSPCIITIRQTLSPDHLLGRVQATSRLMTWVLMPIAAFLAGILAEAMGTSLTIVLAGAISTLSSIPYLHHSLKVQ